ncbi:hypothetical protein TNIN_158771 [Trichonephila inaurata madagascariensis]|uniref:Uncharacterized protein n=1 Tax=Trichonephila inaurata madagascariensis TaxID=2747483 RepID=A0A8X7BRL6_9ARAC|nr:hypothetical protein TNIN_158771 [Trichonephila inaurata madagascariensis]
MYKNKLIKLGICYDIYWRSLSHGAAKGKLLLPLQQLKQFIAASEAVKEEFWLFRLIQDIVNLRAIPILQLDNSVNGSLFKANVEPILPKMTEVYTVVADSSLQQLYHKRCGHQNKHHIRNMLEKELGIRSS